MRNDVLRILLWSEAVTTVTVKGSFRCSLVENFAEIYERAASIFTVGSGRQSQS
jgi:hypothetical protein